ncbi:MAG: carboxypeptidase regulatory-like domain-containing protein, partial [Candidatus Krumholzibacteriota bacterium]|nr:carboxypeptidase regulatory-like domain-containing protein [Candidatus Krumholzibacteriota bacterium]
MSLKGVLVFSTFFVFLFTGAWAQDYSSIQLVGNFDGITCEPDDPQNDMNPLGPHIWRKLKFINEPGDPDTVFFKYTADGSYMPKHWGWSFVKGWGIAAYDWSPPSIAAVLPDSGYWYFHFNDSTFAYWLDRPNCSIAGEVFSDLPSGVPAGASVTLYDSEQSVIGFYTQFADSSFIFEHLPEGIFSLTASAPGYRDSTISDIHTTLGGTEHLSLRLLPVTAVMIYSAGCRQVDRGILLTWTTPYDGQPVGFDIYRGGTPDLSAMQRCNQLPVYGSGDVSYLDQEADRSRDHYYYIVEAGDDNPSRFGPLFAAG